jgi:hypothetical protein
MKKHNFTISIALALLLAGGLGKAEARQRPNFISHTAVSSASGVIDTNRRYPK